MLDLADLCLLLLGRRIGWLRSLRLMFGGRGLFGRVHALVKYEDLGMILNIICLYHS